MALQDGADQKTKGDKRLAFNVFLDTGIRQYHPLELEKLGFVRYVETNTVLEPDMMIRIMEGYPETGLYELGKCRIGNMSKYNEFREAYVKVNADVLEGISELARNPPAIFTLGSKEDTLREYVELARETGREKLKKEIKKLFLS